jgi:hypothetical protein
MLLSAGPDNIFLEKSNEQMYVDEDPAGTLLEPESGTVTPKMMETFDDVVVYGGA